MGIDIFFNIWYNFIGTLENRWPERRIIMDHNYPKKQCPHGRCMKHNPEWKNIGKERYEPNPVVFGLKKTYWTNFCCGKPMARYKEIQKQQCKECGRTRDLIRDHNIALCLCCGYHFSNAIMLAF